MNRDHIPPMSPNNPWHSLSEVRRPNVKWCEAQTDSWVTEPANTWSNLVYLMVGVALVQRAKGMAKALRAYGWVLIALCFCSGIYHASYTFVFQILDFLGMYLLTYLMLLINLKRMGKVKNAVGGLFWGLVIGTTGLTVLADLYTNFPIQVIVFLQVILFFMSEMVLLQKRTKEYSLRYFWMGLLFIVTAGLFSSLDVTRRLCDPENHFVQGHAFWHIFSSIAIWFLFKHHEQFSEELKGN